MTGCHLLRISRAGLIGVELGLQLAANYALLAAEYFCLSCTETAGIDMTVCVSAAWDVLRVLLSHPLLSFVSGQSAEMLHPKSKQCL